MQVIFHVIKINNNKRSLNKNKLKQSIRLRDNDEQGKAKSNSRLTTLDLHRLGPTYEYKYK